MKYFCIMKSNIITLFFLITGIITGQNTGSLNGRIVDAQNQFPLEGATVVVLGTSIGVVSGEGGYFTIEDIPTQTYNIEVSYLGYETQTLFNTIVKSVGNIPLFFELEEIAEDLEEVVLIQSPFKTSSETPLSTQTFSAVEIETYPGDRKSVV